MENIPCVSLIIPVKNEGEHIKNTIESAFSVKTDCAFEIIVVDDNSQDGCCSFLNHSKYDKVKMIKTSDLGAANARNAGSTHAKGEIFIFCDAHLFFEDYWIDRLIEPIQKGITDATNPGIGDIKYPQAIGFGYTWDRNLTPRWNKEKKEAPYPVPLLAGGCLAISRKVFEDIDGFEKGFKVWGREDEEISLKLWLFGYKCYIVPKVKVLHVFRVTTPYELSWYHIDYNFLRMAFLHFNEERINKCKKRIRLHRNANLIEELMKSDILKKRTLYMKKRQHDEDWYMNTFKIPF